MYSDRSLSQEYPTPLSEEELFEVPKHLEGNGELLNTEKTESLVTAENVPEEDHVDPTFNFLLNEKGGKPEEWRSGEHGASNIFTFDGEQLFYSNGESFTKDIEAKGSPEDIQDHYLFLDHLKNRPEDPFAFRDHVINRERLTETHVHIAKLDGIYVSTDHFIRDELKKPQEQAPPIENVDLDQVTQEVQTDLDIGLAEKVSQIATYEGIKQVVTTAEVFETEETGQKATEIQTLFTEPVLVVREGESIEVPSFSQTSEVQKFNSTEGSTRTLESFFLKAEKLAQESPQVVSKEPIQEESLKQEDLSKAKEVSSATQQEIPINKADAAKESLNIDTVIHLAEAVSESSVIESISESITETTVIETVRNTLVEGGVSIRFIESAEAVSTEVNEQVRAEVLLSSEAEKAFEETFQLEEITVPFEVGNNTETVKEKQQESEVVMPVSLENVSKNVEAEEIQEPTSQSTERSQPEQRDSKQDPVTEALHELFAQDMFREQKDPIAVPEQAPVEPKGREPQTEAAYVWGSQLSPEVARMVGLNADLSPFRTGAVAVNDVHTSPQTDSVSRNGISMSRPSAIAA